MGRWNVASCPISGKRTNGSPDGRESQQGTDDGRQAASSGQASDWTRFRDDQHHLRGSARSVERDRDKEGGAVALPITQSDIADLFDVTRQSVHREVTNLRQLKLFDKQRGDWLVLDPVRLRQICSS